MSEQQLLDEFSRLAKACLVIHGTDFYRESGGAFVNARVGTLNLHVSSRRLTVYEDVAGAKGKGMQTLVYSENGKGACTSRTLPLLPEAMQIMRTALVLDELARI